MLPLKFGYLIVVIVGMIFWIVFFILRKDLRKTMIWTGILYGILSLITAKIWWIDWWHPMTITGAQVGIEDFFTGFGAGGVMMVIYQTIFKKITVDNNKKISPIVRLIFPILVLFSIDILIRYLGFNSFESFTIITSISTLFIWILRRDLIIPSIWSGILTTVAILPLYWSAIITVPGWVNYTYDFNTLSGKLITGIPIEELIFWIISGTFVGILHLFMRSKKYVS